MSVESGPAPIPRSTVFAVIAATTIGQVANVMGTAVFPVIAPNLAAELAVQPALIGYQVSLIYLAATVMAPFLSSLIPRWGGCRMTQIGLAMCALAMTLSLVPSLFALAAASILIGMATGVMTPASAHLLFRFSPPENRNFIFSLKQTGVPLAWMLMALIAPPITLAFGWRWALALILAMAVTMIAVLQPARAGWDDDRAPHAAAKRTATGGFIVVWRHPVLRPIAIMSFWCSFVQLCFSSFTVTMLVEEAGYSLITAGLLVSLGHAAGVAGRIVWGWIADALKASLGVLRWINIVMVACCALTAFVSPGWPVAAVALLFVVFGASAVGWNGIFIAEVARHSPHGQVGVATGGAMVLNFGGIVAGPAIFATVYGLTGSYTATFGWLTLIAVLGLIYLQRTAAAARPRRLSDSVIE